MKRTVLTIVGAASVASITAFGGCANLIPLQAVSIPLGGSLTQFQVSAGVPNDQTGTASFTSPVQLGRGNLELDRGAISFAPTANGKRQLAAQDATTTIVVTVWIGDLDQADTVFDDGDQYGPFNVTFNADFSSVTIDPPTATLTPRTIELLNSGMLSLGIRIESPVDGTLTIDSLTFNVSL